MFFSQRSNAGKATLIATTGVGEGGQILFFDDSRGGTAQVKVFDNGTLDITTTPAASPRTDAEVAEILANPGFGSHFTDHMLTVEWTPEQGWHAARIEQYGPLSMDSASAVLHYAQEIFEGLKAYRSADGGKTFAPVNAGLPAGNAILDESTRAEVVSASPELLSA